MSIKKISETQPESFEFSQVNLQEAENIIKKYPKNRKASAVLALLYLVQKQHYNWIPLAAIKYVAKFLEIPYIQVYEVATFYSMYNLNPVGKYFIQVCTTTPCMIRGANKIIEVCRKKISQAQNELSQNNIASWTEVECLGACVNAPMMQINDDYFEDLDEKNMSEVIDLILNDKQPNPGSYRNRKSAEPENKRTTLTNIKNA